MAHLYGIGMLVSDFFYSGELQGIFLECHPLLPSPTKCLSDVIKTGFKPLMTFLQCFDTLEGGWVLPPSDVTIAATPFYVVKVFKQRHLRLENCSNISRLMQ